MGDPFMIAITENRKIPVERTLTPWTLGGQRVIKTPAYLGPLGYDKHPVISPARAPDDLFSRAGFK